MNPIYMTQKVQSSELSYLNNLRNKLGKCRQYYGYVYGQQKRRSGSNFLHDVCHSNGTTIETIRSPRSAERVMYRRSLLVPLVYDRCHSQSKQQHFTITNRITIILFVTSSVRLRKLNTLDSEKDRNINVLDRLKFGDRKNIDIYGLSKRSVHRYLTS